MENKYGMIRGESNDAYHGNDAVSNSSLKTFMQSRYLYMRRFITKDMVQEQTPAMKTGSSVHEFILEPDVFAQNHAFLPPDFNGRTSEGKALKAQMESDGKTTLSLKEADELAALRDSVYGNPTAAMLLSNGEPELTWRIKHPAFDFDMQSRTDWFAEATKEQAAELQKCGMEIEAGQPFIADLKTTADLAPWFRDNYSNQIYSFGYHLQNAFYRAVVNQIRKAQGLEIVRHFFFIVVEKKPPIDCAVVALSERSFGLAETQLKHNLSELGNCYKTGRWEGYKDRGILIAGVPEHIAEREEQEIRESRA